VLGRFGAARSSLKKRNLLNPLRKIKQKLRNKTMTEIYQYPAKATPNGEGGFIGSFRDVPEALTEAESIEELKEMALDALVTSIDFYEEDGKEFPAPSAPQPGELMIELPPEAVQRIKALKAQ